VDDAFASFVAARWPALLRSAYLLTGDRGQAEDLVQSALARTYVAWARVEAPEAYVRRAMVNTHTSWWRRHRDRETVTDVLPEPRGRGAALDAVETVVARSTLWPHLARLPRGQRTVVVLRFYEDLTEAQTADLLGISIGTVKSQTSRAMAALRAALTETPTGTTGGQR